MAVSGRSEVLPTGVMSSALSSCRPLHIRNYVHLYTEFIRARIAAMHIDEERSPVVADLIQLVTAAHRRSRRTEMELIDSHDLSLSQYKILSALDCTPQGLRPSELAVQIGLSPGATSRAAEGLVQDELLARSDDDAD